MLVQPSIIALGSEHFTLVCHHLSQAFAVDRGFK